MNNGVEINRIRTDFMAKYSDRVVKEIYKGDGGYIVVAPHKDTDGTDYSDPFFLMIEDGRVTPFIPSQNFKLYEDAMQNQIYGD